MRRLTSRLAAPSILVMSDGVTWIRDAAKQAVDRVNRGPGNSFVFPADVDLFFDFVADCWRARVGDFVGTDQHSPVQAFNNIGVP